MGEKKKILIADNDQIAIPKIINYLKGEEQSFEINWVANSQEALEFVIEEKPDLLILSIELAGNIDGIETAKKIKEIINIPVIFLSNYTDKETLKRAKTAAPSAYIIKPFNQFQFYSTITMILYNSESEVVYRENQRWFQTTLKSIGDAVIATDCIGRVKFMNMIAEKLTGWNQAEARGNKLERIFKIYSELSGARVENPANKVLQTGTIVGLANHTILKRRDGEIIPIDDSAAPIWNDENEIDGVVLVFRDVSERKEMEKQQKKLEDNLRDSKQKIKELHHVARRLNLCQNKNEVYQITVEAAERILKFDLCTLDIAEGDMFNVKAYSSAMNRDLTVSMPINEGMAGKTYQNKKSYLTNDIMLEKSAKPTNSEFKSAISIPIGDVGIFQVISTEYAAFSEEDLELAELLISHTETALRRIKSEEKIRYFGFHDPTTDLYNRSYFDVELERLDTARQLPLSIIMGDVNGLKLVNDAFGHKQGDELLIRIARIIEESCRQEDIIARWGGDEFMILLPMTDAKAAIKVAKRIKKGCEQADNEPIKPSIALGIATKNDPVEDIELVFKRAEDRMYRNKLKESKTATNSIISTLAGSLRDKEIEAEEHGNRIKKMSINLGEMIGLAENKLEELSLLAVLHDIGQLAIADDILFKPGPLNLDQWSMIKKHPEIGYRIAKSSPEIAAIAEDILSHHEWWNGSGYPQGLSGKDIPLLARIIAIADAFDVMTHDRPYKKAITFEEAIEELKAYSGVQFDPELVESFLGVAENNK